jgi:hypothetical protein
MQSIRLSEQAKDALRRIKALRKFPTSPSTQRAETKILESLSLKEVSDVALVLAEEDAGNKSGGGAR